MRETSAGSTMHVAGVARAILWGTGTAGLLDLAFAFTAGGLRGSSPVRVLQGIATGLFGRNAFYGDVRTALATHRFAPTPQPARRAAAAARLASSNTTA